MLFISLTVYVRLSKHHDIQLSNVVGVCVCGGILLFHFEWQCIINTLEACVSISLMDLDTRASSFIPSHTNDPAVPSGLQSYTKQPHSHTFRFR